MITKLDGITTDQLDSYVKLLVESVESGELSKAGWTLKRTGVIYNHDPGDEHVETYPDRWAP